MGEYRSLDDVPSHVPDERAVSDCTNRSGNRKAGAPDRGTRPGASPKLEVALLYPLALLVNLGFISMSFSRRTTAGRA